MIPVWGDERRRPINLGGSTTSASSHAAILDQAKARRLEREDNRRREENAVKLQAWWRGVREARLVREQMKIVFERDVNGITALRCLVLIGRSDERVLGQWSTSMTEGQSH
jgi:ubiquitin-protein ligase E3 C